MKLLVMNLAIRIWLWHLLIRRDYCEAYRLIVFKSLNGFKEQPLTNIGENHEDQSN